MVANLLSVAKLVDNEESTTVLSLGETESELTGLLAHDGPLHSRERSLI
jgi:hypothetical protein